MNFYVDQTFFLLLAIVAIPAVVLGVRGKHIAPYGFAVSLLFLVLLFYKDIGSGIHLLIYIALETVIAFATLWYHRRHGKKPLLFYLAVLVAIAPLVTYKVGAVFSANLLGFLGISYITFKSVQVIMEIHDGLIKKMSLYEYWGFLLFFASFTSGPIDRSRRFADEMHRTYGSGEYLDLLSKGLFWLLLGAVYKMVLSGFFYQNYVPVALSAMAIGPGILNAIKNAYAYGFYMFFDFAGYTLMAMGTAAIFGVHLPANFRYPFKSLDIKDFWNRWHITLSFWLRDFVFMRVVRTAVRHKWFSSRITTACLGYMANMTLMGFWHGITLDYIIYGLYHGVLLSATEVYQKKSKFYKRHKDSVIYQAISWFVTINLVMLGFAIFSGELAKLIAG